MLAFFMFKPFLKTIYKIYESNAISIRVFYRT